ncbi:temptin-like isoform X1 [Crassostrea angulata]|uniref:temptin-like isoform X1 n=1 Tax=Magallana angulata TaxID=2784310 RepID=UPI0022B0FD74|nr:temptin-like isoform X1 [Crassostrea angulata]
MLISIFLGTLLFTVAHFLPSYKNLILNGNNVPDPCCPRRTWGRVGHSSPNSRDLNNFGRDFQRNGHKFTEELCLADSDRDGVPNGVELGLNTTRHNIQTLCQFVASYTFNAKLINFLERKSLLGRPIGHPGICDQNSCPPNLRYRCGRC